MRRCRARPAPAAALLLAAAVLAACDTGTRPAGPEAGEEQAAEAEPPSLHPEVDVLDHTLVTIETAGGEEVAVRARVAATPAERRRGLMGVPELPGGVGMLFVFDEDRDGGFWMKDTLVPLDIAFVDADGRIVEILAMEPCEAEPCPVYEPGVLYRAALEVPQGWLAEQGVEVGDRVGWAPP